MSICPAATDTPEVMALSPVAELLVAADCWPLTLLEVAKAEDDWEPEAAAAAICFKARWTPEYIQNDGKVI